MMLWRVIMACSAAKSFVLSLLESRTCVSSDGDFRYEPVGEQQVLTVVLIFDSFIHFAQTKTNVRVRDLCVCQGLATRLNQSSLIPPMDQF